MYTGTWDDCRQGWPPDGGHTSPALLVAREVEADAATPSKDGLVGGARPVLLSIEYMVDAGAASPSVKVLTASGGSSATWSDDAPAEGFTLRQSVLGATPGTKVTLQVNDAIARLRWCEVVCC